MKKIFIIMIMLVLITGCGEKKEDTKSNSNSNSNQITSNQQEKGYTDEELVKMAKEYYEKTTNKKAPKVEIDHKEGDKVVIHIYEDKDDHVTTIDWYTIDSKTGKGTNFDNSEIDLTK